MKYIPIVATLMLLLSSCSNSGTEKQIRMDKEIASIEATVNNDLMSGEELFKATCNACHGIEVSDPKARLAPPAVVVKQRYARWFDNEEAFIDRVTNWIANPDKEKSLMPGAINRFNLMPPLPLPETDRRKIAEYFYATDFEEPQWIKDHHREGGQQHSRAGE
jgi:mono/diheme cytochrome c family protein